MATLLTDRLLMRTLYPRRCPVCHDPVRGEGLVCPECRQLLSYVQGPVCCKCGKEIRSTEDELCPDCAAHPKSFDQGVALLNYDDIARASIVKFKYGGRREYADFYGAEMVRRFGRRIRYFSPDAIVPVPVHVSRLRFRGYNQAEVLADRIGEGLGLAVVPGALGRTKKTTAQKQLNAAQRMSNLMQAMEAGPEAKTLRRVLLVDDIYTTGSTLEACSRVLLRAGVTAIMPACICIGRNT